VGGEEVLSPHRARRLAATVVAAALALVLGLYADVRAQGDSDGVRRPERLTTGTSDQLLGQLSPDERTLYFVSNRNTTYEIYAQDAQASRARLLFDEGADVTWPRVSPDGRRLLYISFRTDAAGQLCVRHLPDRPRRCLDNAGSAVQAQWIDNGRIALVSRSSLEGDLQVLEVKVEPKLSARLLLERNLTGPAISPDGRWLVYVPVERYVEQIGPSFAARAAPRLEAVRLDRAGSSQAQPLMIDLPGLSSQPAFSLDGRSLYVTQFFNDSNHDGEIDASDHGVLFRVPFEPDKDDAPARVAAASPEQLTDASWNCQYPSPAADQLIATCSRNTGLDIYSLPLDGQVPGDWSADRLRLEIDLSSRQVEQLLLYRHLLQRETQGTAQRAVMMNLLRLHLDAEEFDAAEFYARKIKAMRDKQTAGVASTLATFIEHRRAVRARERGRTGVEFQADSRRRMEALSTEQARSPAAAALRRIVRSEIADALGDKDAARRELEAAPLDDVTLLPVLDTFYDRADTLYRSLDDREALVATCRRLAEHPALPLDDRLRYARAAVRALVRGLPYAEAEAALARERARATPDSEFAFALELGDVALRIRTEQPPRAVRDALVEFYKRQTRHDRQRAVMLDAVQRASEFEAERMIEALAQLYIDDVPRGTQERRRAERLYERVMLGRAYRRLSRGFPDVARDTFAKIARTTGSLEAHVGYIDLRLQEGAQPADIEAEYAQRDADFSEPVLHFARAYLMARALPTLRGEAHAKAVKRTVEELRRTGPTLKGQAGLRVLYGAVYHESYLEDGTLTAAQRANIHYLLGLELVQRNPRYRTLLLGQLALLQSQVGNYRIALGYLKERDRLPANDDLAGLGQRLTKARTLFHVDRTEDAAAAADEALALLDRTPALAEYRPLVLDRTALYNLAAGRSERALALYDAELPLLEQITDAAAQRNQVVVRLARAAAALGAGQPRRALTDLDFVDRRLVDRRLRSSLTWPHTPVDEVLRAYQLIAAGLRANVHYSLGELEAASRALEVRRALAELRLARSKQDEHLRALTLIEARLADLSRDRGDHVAAVKWVKSALGHADEYVRRTGVPLHNDQLDLLRFAAELSLSTGQRLKLKLPHRLREAHDKMAKEQDPTFRGQQRWFEIYLTLFGTRNQRRASLDDVANGPAAPATQAGIPAGLPPE
jgi:hypothetical protein